MEIKKKGVIFMRYGFRRQKRKNESILQSGIRTDLKGLLCLFLAVLMISTCAITPTSDVFAAEITLDQKDIPDADELMDTSEQPESPDEADVFKDLTVLPEDSGSDEYQDPEAVIEETTEEEEDVFPEDMEWADGPVDGSWEDALFADEDGLIMDPDPADDPAEADLTGLDDFIDGDVITIMMDDPIVSNPDQAAGSGKRLLKGARNTGTFTNFYDQLEEPAQTFYNLRKSHFADGRQTGTLTQQFSKPGSEDDPTKPPSPCSFLCDIVPKTDADGNPTGSWTYDNTCDRFRDGYEELLYYVRASFDAFYYDHPEVFWTRSTSLGFSFGGYNLNTDERTATIYLSKITLIPVAAYDNAASQVAAFDQAVADTAAQISSASDYDGDGTVSSPELLQGIHDFLCLRCYYDNDGLNTYKTTGDYSIFTPGPVFLETRAGVVCEGYTRAFKVLCDHFGIACAIVSGKAHTYSTIGHAWNAVNLDGNWYMIDTTWDDVADTQEEIKYQYYLCALNTSNYGSNQLSDRAVNGKIGGNDTTSTTSSGLRVTTRKKVFEFPTYWSGAHTFEETGLDGVPAGDGTEAIPACVTLFACNEQGPEAVRYHKIGHDWDGGVIETAASCEEAGILRYTCRNNPNHIKDESIPATGHDWGDGVIISEATCTLPGTIRYVCENNASHSYEEEIPIDHEAHDWDEGSVTKEPVCSETGIRTYTCRRDAGHTKTEEIPVDPQAHHWDGGVITKPASCTETGIRLYTCTYNASHVKNISIPVDASAHDWGEWKTAKEATSTENGVEIRVCRNSASHVETRPKKAAEGSSEGKTTLTAPKKPVWRSVKANGSRKILAKWKKVKGASGYELQVSSRKNFKKKYTVTITLRPSRYYRTIRKLKKGRKYYVRIRAFAQAGELRLNGPWSRIKSATAG